MRCLAILLAEDYLNPRRGQVALVGLRERLGYQQFPVEEILYLFVEVEMERRDRGKPVEMRVELLNMDRADPPVELTRATGIIQMPLDENLPPIFTMSHQLRWPFPEPGIYQVSVYLNAERAAHRLITIQQTAPQTD